MYELVYTSAATRLFSPVELGELLKTARANNHAVGVTGILLYHEGSFIQVLEGDQARVQEIFAKVSQDKRHWKVLVLRQGAVESRRFEEWSMGFVTLDVQLLKDLVGRHALRSNGSLTDDASEIASILDCFREGQWRRYVNG